MEQLEQRFQGHDRRITDAENRLREIELRETKRDGQMELFKMSLETVDSKVTDIKDSVKDVTTAVKEDGEKTRASQEAQQNSLVSLLGRVMDRMDNQDGMKESAATREHETKRTKMQVVKDISIALFALVGTVVGGVVAYQELIVGLLK